MATHRIPILGFSTRPDDSAEAFFQPADIDFGSNDLAREFLLCLGAATGSQPSVKHGVYGKFNVPKNYVGSASIVIRWSATLTSGDVVFDFDYNAVGGNDAETYDPSAWQESVTVTDTAPGTARRRLETSVSITSANLAVDDDVQFFFGRDGAAGADTMAGRAYVAEVLLQYNDV